MFGRHSRRGDLRRTAVSPAHPASFHRRPGRVDGIALKRARIRLRLAADRSDVATLIASAIARLRRSGHARAVSNAKAVSPLPGPSRGTIAPEARELVATARSRAPANPSAASEWPCNRPNFARNPSSSAGDRRRRIPEIGNGGIATEQFIRSWVATRKALGSSNRSCRSVPASSLSEFPSMSHCGGRPCCARQGSDRTLANERHRYLWTGQGPRCCWRQQSGSRRLHAQGATGAGRGSRSMCTRDAVRSVGGSKTPKDSWLDSITGIYERIRCLRGDAENRLREFKAGLGLDRTSCHRFLAN